MCMGSDSSSPPPPAPPPQPDRPIPSTTADQRTPTPADKQNPTMAGQGTQVVRRPLDIGQPQGGSGLKI